MVLAIQDLHLQLIPLGAIFILYSFNSLAKSRLGTAFWIYQLGYAMLIAVGIWWVVRTPEFIKPHWVRWVEAYPEQTYQAMQQAVQEDPGLGTPCRQPGESRGVDEIA